MFYIHIPYIDPANTTPVSAVGPVTLIRYLYHDVPRCTCRPRLCSRLTHLRKSGNHQLSADRLFGIHNLYMDPTLMVSVTHLDGCHVGDRQWCIIPYSHLPCSSWTNTRAADHRPGSPPCTDSPRNLLWYTIPRCHYSRNKSTHTHFPDMFPPAVWVRPVAARQSRVGWEGIQRWAVRRFFDPTVSGPDPYRRGTAYPPLESGVHLQKLPQGWPQPQCWSDHPCGRTFVQCPLFLGFSPPHCEHFCIGTPKLVSRLVPGHDGTEHGGPTSRGMD